MPFEKSVIRIKQLKLTFFIRGLFKAFSNAYLPRHFPSKYVATLFFHPKSEYFQGKNMATLFCLW